MQIHMTGNKYGGCKEDECKTKVTISYLDLSKFSIIVPFTLLNPRGNTTNTAWQNVIAVIKHRVNGIQLYIYPVSIRAACFISRSREMYAVYKLTTGKIPLEYRVLNM